MSMTTIVFSRSARSRPPTAKPVRATRSERTGSRPDPATDTPPAVEAEVRQQDVESTVDHAADPGSETLAPTADIPGAAFADSDGGSAAVERDEGAADEGGQVVGSG